MPLRTSAASQVPQVPRASSPQLAEGSRGAQVTTLQRFLKNRDPSLEVDGNFGPRTAAAVQSFQRASGLDVDGVVGPQTQAAIARATRPATSSVRPGDRGPQVKELKTLLSRAGFYDGVINDELGPQGVAALRDAKRALGLTGGDVAGPTTFEALRRRVPTTSPSPASGTGSLAHPWLRTLATAPLRGGPTSSCVATTLGNLDRLGIPSFSGGTTADPNNARGAMVQMVANGHWRSLALPGAQQRSISSPYGRVNAYVLDADRYEAMARRGAIPSGAVLFQTRHGWSSNAGPYGNDMGIVRDGGRTTFNYAAMPPIIYGDAREVVVLVPR